VAFKTGNKTQYKPEYDNLILEFFSGPPFKEEIEKKYYKNGQIIKTMRQVANPLPFLSGFARKIGVNSSTLYKWAQKYPSFGMAYTQAKELTLEFLVTNTLLKLYDSQFGKFAAQNISEWRDVKEQKVDAQVTVHVSDKFRKGKPAGKSKPRTPPDPNKSTAEKLKSRS
jgi:hypothetical protein